MRDGHPQRSLLTAVHPQSQPAQVPGTHICPACPGTSPCWSGCPACTDHSHTCQAFAQCERTRWAGRTRPSRGQGAFPTGLALLDPLALRYHPAPCWACSSSCTQGEHTVGLAGYRARAGIASAQEKDQVARRWPKSWSSGLMWGVY